MQDPSDKPPDEVGIRWHGPLDRWLWHCSARPEPAVRHARREVELTPYDRKAL